MHYVMFRRNAMSDGVRQSVYRQPPGGQSGLLSPLPAHAEHAGKVEAAHADHKALSLQNRSSVHHCLSGCRTLRVGNFSHNYLQQHLNFNWFPTQRRHQFGTIQGVLSQWRMRCHVGMVLRDSIPSYEECLA